MSNKSKENTSAQELLDIIRDIAMGNEAEIERMVTSPSVGDVVEVYVACINKNINPEDLSWGPLGKTWSHVLGTGAQGSARKAR